MKLLAIRAPPPTISPKAELFKLAANNYGVFSRNDARSCGCSDSVLSRLVASGQAERIFPRVFRLTAAPRSWTQQARAATLYAGKVSWLSHRSAASHQDMIDGRPDVIEIVSTRDLRSRPGFKVRRVGEMPHFDVRTLGGIPVTNTIRTMIDLADVLSPERLEDVLDDCLYRGLVELSRLDARLRSLGGPGRRRTQVLKHLLAVRGDGCAVPLTVLERKFLKVLRDAGIEEPEKQVPVEAGEAGKWRLDFVYPQHKVHIEVDGARWHAGRKMRKSDRVRDNFMNVRGWIVLRFSWEDVLHDPEYVVEQVCRALGLA